MNKHDEVAEALVLPPMIGIALITKGPGAGTLVDLSNTLPDGSSRVIGRAHVDVLDAFLQALKKPVSQHKPEYQQIVRHALELAESSNVTGHMLTYFDIPRPRFGEREHVHEKAPEQPPS